MYVRFSRGGPDHYIPELFTLYIYIYQMAKPVNTDPQLHMFYMDRYWLTGDYLTIFPR